MKDQQLVRFGRTAMSLAVLAVAMSAAQAQNAAPAADDKDAAAPRVQDDKVRLGTVVVVGSGNKLGSGLMVNDDSVKNRSLITKASLEKEASTGNVYQSISMLPGVNTYNYDATGLFGGGLTIRGFGSDQLGFTINGVPVNDSGNFAVYPQEFIDKENVCQAQVAQGSTDLETASGSASGGSVGVITCDPEDKFRFRAAQTFGDLNMFRTYVRLDTGRFANGMAKVFLSYSHTEADKWKGLGKGKKDHLDFGFSLDLSPDNKILGSVLYNRAINNNIYSLSRANVAQYGYNYDYSLTPKAHLTPGAGAQTETALSPIYWGTSLNPFENVIASVSGSFKLAQDTYLKVQPYMWYGFGNGGWSEVLLKENGGLLNAARTGFTPVDLNGDGDTLDTWRVARSSVTKTQRPGVTAEVSTTVDTGVFGSHYMKLGAWFERAQHRQTQPAVVLNSDGSPADMWLRNGCIQRADGTCYQGRDWKTISTAHQVYVSDNISFLEDRAVVSLGVRMPTVKRDVTNYASEASTVSTTSPTATTGTNVYQDYQISRSFTKALPQVGVRFSIDASNQVYANVSKNFRAPPNIAFTGGNVRFVNGVITPWIEVTPETTVMTDIGYRFQSKQGSLSVTYFNSDFKNRQATATDPNTTLSVYTNAGRVNNRGFEFEAASKVYNGFSAYASLTFQKSEMKDDIAVTANTLGAGVTSKNMTLPTTGKEFALTPKRMAALSLQYEQGPFYARVKAKYTGSQYATLMNDEAAEGYKTFDLESGYKFGDFGMLKAAQVRLNVANITSTKFYSPSSGTVLNAVAYKNAAGSTYNSSGVFYYLGAPRMATITLSADFQ